MDNIILGLLLLCSRTIYQLRERIDQGLRLMYSSSMGSIQAAIRKLLECGYIGFEETVENGKYKKVYHITDAGRQHFFAWVNGPMEQQGIRCPGLVKLYFLGFADEKNREASLEACLAALREQHQALALICEEAKHVAVPADKEDIFQYQLASARYGRDLYQFNIQWFEDLLKKVRNHDTI